MCSLFLSFSAFAEAFAAAFVVFAYYRLFEAALQAEKPCFLVFYRLDEPAFDAGAVGGNAVGEYLVADKDDLFFFDPEMLDAEKNSARRRLSGVGYAEKLQLGVEDFGAFAVVV